MKEVEQYLFLLQKEIRKKSHKKIKVASISAALLFFFALLKSKTQLLLFDSYFYFAVLMRLL